MDLADDCEEVARQITAEVDRLGAENGEATVSLDGLTSLPIQINGMLYAGDGWWPASDFSATLESVSHGEAVYLLAFSESPTRDPAYPHSEGLRR